MQSSIECSTALIFRALGYPVKNAISPKASPFEYILIIFSPFSSA